MKASIFLSVKDLMLLNGSDNYNSTSKSHRAIRDSICSGKQKLTIKEYCTYEKLDFKDIWKFLRGGLPPY